MVNLFVSPLTNIRFTFHCDNLAIFHILKKLTTPIKSLMLFVRKTVILMLNNIWFSVEHIPGLDNHICDHLSRQHIGQ